MDDLECSNEKKILRTTVSPNFWLVLALQPPPTSVWIATD